MSRDIFRRWSWVGCVALIAVTAATTFAVAQGQRRERRERAQPQESDAPPIPQIGQIKDFDEWVVSVAYSPDGKLLAAGTYEGVKLCDPGKREVVATLPVKSGFAQAVAFSPDGKTLAAGSYQSARLWDVEKREPTIEFAGHRGYVTGIAYSPDGTQVATSSEDETARLWSTADGKEIRVLKGHTYPVRGVAFSPDGTLVATAAGDETRVTRSGEVKLWEAATGAEKFDLPEHKRAATGVAFSPDGKYLASTSVDETVNVYDASTGKALGFFGGHSRPTNSVLFAPGGDKIVSASGGRAQGGNEIKIWNRADGEVLGSADSHEGKVTALALSPDGRTLASASYDKTLVLWDVGKLLGTEGEKVAAADEKQESAPAAAEDANGKVLRAGIIGLDTSHATAFAKMLNDANPDPDVAGCRVVAAYPKGSPDIQSSVERVPKYTEEVTAVGVEIVDSIDALLEKVDVVFLETNDGRPHLEQAIPVFKAGKPTFIDKPIAGTLTDAVAIFEAARKYGVPVFSSSSLRFAAGAQALRNGKIGEITGCDAYSPCSLEATHPDLFWYGIHGVETLFTVMGTGCESVSRLSTPDFDLAAGTWNGGRIGTFRGIRAGKGGYGGTAFGAKGVEPIGPYDGYKPLLVEIVKFFRTHEPPVSEAETLEIYAFMEAADESKRQGGVPVTLESVLAKAREDAAGRLAEVEGR